MGNITLFAQIARLIPRIIVEEAAKKFKSNKGASRLDTWTHLLSMIFCHIGNYLSLRDITNGMRNAGGNLNHMGIGSTPHEMRSATKTGSETVAALDKARWDIEIFFKTIKLLLRVKSFVGTNAYAVYTQIRTAMIAVLLLRMLKAQSKYAWHMSNPASFLRLNLFNKIDLWKWLNEPFEKPPPRQKRYGMGCFSSFAASLPATPHDSSILFPFAQTLGQVWRLPW